MNDRINAALDGELPREALSPEELARLAVTESRLKDAVDAFRAVPAPDLTSRVMASLPERPEERRSFSLGGRLAAIGRWLWEPRPISIGWRPAYSLAPVLGAILLLFALPGASIDDGSPPVAATPEAPRLYVQFRLDAPGASRVEVAGSFTGWQPGVELYETAPGIWSALIPLEPGVHDYSFVIDGTAWVPDPYAPNVDDGFGGWNSRLFLVRPNGNV